MTVHYQHYGRAACSLMRSHPTWTVMRDTRKVTCKNCKRTIHYKHNKGR